MTIVEKIKQEARMLGACPKVQEVRTQYDLIDLLFTPQGTEFCKEHAFPSRELIEQLSGDPRVLHRQEETFYLNAPYRAVVDTEREHVIRYDNPAHKYKLLLYHGAKVRIEVADYVIVEVVEIGEGNRLTIDKEGDNAMIIHE